jgi:hypothetical protein
MTLSDKAREYADFLGEKRPLGTHLRDLLRQLADENDRLRNELGDHTEFERKVTSRATLKEARRNAESME